MTESPAETYGDQVYDEACSIPILPTLIRHWRRSKETCFQRFACSPGFTGKVTVKATTDILPARATRRKIPIPIGADSVIHSTGLVALGALIVPFAMQGRPGCGEQLLAGRAALHAGRYAEAELQYSAALPECEKSTPADARLMTVLAELGFARMALGHHDAAAAVLQRALGILEGFPESNPSDAAKLWQALGTTYYQEHLYSQAEYAYRRALELRAAAGTLDLQLAGELSSNLAVVYIAQHQNEKANAALGVVRQALDQSRGTDSNWR